MAKNFPEIWEGRVRHNLEKGAVADFLDGVPELDGNVTLTFGLSYDFSSGKKLQMQKKLQNQTQGAVSF